MKYPFQHTFDENSSLGKIFKNIDRGSTVLECGCAGGYFTKYLKEALECKVYIVELDPEGYTQVINYAEKGICGDLMDFEWVEEFRDIKFDYVVFADVLEHLLNPQKVLSEAAKMIKEDGTIFLSLPNIGHNDIVSKLIDGHWDYTVLGLLDDSHIHFWAYENLNTLAKESGLAITMKDYTIIKTGCTEQYKSAEFNVSDIVKEVLYGIQYGEVYQFILALQKEDYVERNSIVCKDNLSELECENKTGEIDSGYDRLLQEKIQSWKSCVKRLLTLNL